MGNWRHSTAQSGRRTRWGPDMVDSRLRGRYGTLCHSWVIAPCRWEIEKQSKRSAALLGSNKGRLRWVVTLGGMGRLVEATFPKGAQRA